jgi:DNA-binding transcriptional LysR family regulator
MDVPDLRALRYFVVLAEECNFTRAAERLGIAQPPLTQQIQKLERMLGCPLLIRGRQTTLTEAGQRLAQEARHVLDQAEHAVDMTRRVARGEEGELRVGVPPSIMLTTLPAAIREFRQRYPKVAFTLREMGTSAIEAALRNREIDLGFLRETPVGAPLLCQAFFAERLVAILPSKHRLAKERSVRLRALGGDPFVFFPRRVGPEFYDAILSDCGKSGFTPNIVQEATQWQSVIALVEAGMGVAIAPECVAKFTWPGVVFRTLLGVNTMVYAGWTADAPASATTFLRMARPKSAHDRDFEKEYTRLPKPRSQP